MTDMALPFTSTPATTAQRVHGAPGVSIGKVVFTLKEGCSRA
jgi:hypothetical protein